MARVIRAGLEVKACFFFPERTIHNHKPHRIEETVRAPNLMIHGRIDGSGRIYYKN